MNIPVNHKNKQRISEVDGLKGLAIFAILSFHCINHFNFFEYPAATNAFIEKSDSIIDKLSTSFLFGKLYLIFALLFGFTFFLQSQALKDKGVYSHRKLATRISLLLIFGTVNSLFFPDGDILVQYGIIGLCLIPIHQFKTPVLVFIATFLLLQPFQLYYIFQLSTDSAYLLPQSYSGIFKAELTEVLKNGSLWEIAWSNITKGQISSLFWSFESGRFTQIMGIFLFGIIAGRLGIFNLKFYNRNFWLGVMGFAAIFFIITYSQKEMAINKDLSEDLLTMISLTYSLWLNLLFSFIIIATFIIVYNSPLKKWLHPFTYLGKMSLTNYIFQSIIGSLIFLPFGLDLANKIGITYSFIISIGIGILLIFFSKNWLSVFKHGPLEWAWIRMSKFRLA